MAGTSLTDSSSLTTKSNAMTANCNSQAATDLEKNVPPPLPPSITPPSDSPHAPPPPLLHRAHPHLAAEVSPDHTDILLLMCCFVSGLVDSTIYAAFGTFVSMQTGNTVFLGLGGSTSHSTSKPYGWAKSFVSIVCFSLGCAFFSHAMYWLGNQRRSLVFSFALQSMVVFIAAAVVQGGVVNGSLNVITDDVDWWTVLPIALLSFQSSGQMVGSRALQLSEIPTVVLTSVIHDITTDRGLLAPVRSNVKRNRRVIGFFTLLVGAVAGGFIAEGTKRMQIPLWIAGAIKMGVTIAWLIWPQRKVEKG